MLSRAALLARRVPLRPRRALSDKVVADMRLDHGAGGLRLDEADAGAAPLPLFRRWFADAVAHPDIVEANAMALATVDAATLQPSCRVVLLKGYDKKGFTWFTNYASRKAAELEHGRAALTFWWPPLERSVRVEGTVEKVAPSGLTPCCAISSRNDMAPVSWPLRMQHCSTPSYDRMFGTRPNVLEIESMFGEDL